MSKVEKLGLRSDLEAALTEETAVIGFKKPLKAASEHLQPDEKVIAATKAARKMKSSTHNGALIVTDKRLIFVHARGFAVETEEMAFANLTGVVDRAGLALGKLVVTGAGGITTEFVNINKARVPVISGAIKARLNAGQSVGRSTGPDLADQLRKLGELRDSGVLTEEEFSAKKADLLSRM